MHYKYVTWIILIIAPCFIYLYMELQYDKNVIHLSETENEKMNC